MLTCLRVPLRFCANGAVRQRANGVFEVTAGSVLIGTFTRDEPARRDLLLIALVDNPQVRLGDLAWAFGISTERLRQVRRFEEEHGPDALFSRTRGRQTLNPRLKQRIRALFEQELFSEAARDDGGTRVRRVRSVRRRRPARRSTRQR